MDRTDEDTWLGRSVRHYSTVDILRCARQHTGSRVVYTDTVPLPARPSVKRISKYVFCGTCDRSIKDRRWCDGCGRPEGYATRFHPMRWVALGAYLGAGASALISAFL